MKAHCDLATGEIYGCKKGSWKWWHEKGHIVFNSSPNQSWILMIKSYTFDIWMVLVMFSIVIKSAFPLMTLSWLIYIGITIYEEWWCNQYANSKVKGVKK